MSSSSFAGTHVAIVTPFRDDGELDLTAWARLLDWHLASGTDGVVVGGSTGESPTVSEGELLELTRRARAQVGNRLQLVVGCGGNSLGTALPLGNTVGGAGLAISTGGGETGRGRAAFGRCGSPRGERYFGGTPGSGAIME
jgi:dihydrodipicolinate synthase/N-acetylneuraminate lyase